jgi:hypothetical protein
MKRIGIFVIVFFLLGIFFNGCTDDCDSRLYYTYLSPVYMTTQEIRDAFEYQKPIELSIPGKIYLFGNHLFVNEVGKGIHIINNADKRNPVNIGFINIPGNYDMAVKGNILYADNYIDLLALDISNTNDVKLVKRLEGVFNDHYHYEFIDQNQEAVIVSYEEVDTTWYDNPDCGGVMPQFLRSEGGFIAFGGAMDAAAPNSAPPPSGLPTGIGGSMARFAIVNDILYTIGSYNLGVFDITTTSDPVFGNHVEIGWNIETIFPYENNLFIGAQNGMYIYDISEPSAPEYMSTFAHVSSCDPVVVNDDYAFVTLRSGTVCEGFTNQLDVIDIGNLYNPYLVKSYPMKNPHGLGLDGDALFICEGEWGLKIFNASDINTITNNLIKHYTDMHSYDVIPFNDNLIMIGRDGLYQYDYTSLENIQLLSHLPIYNENQ